VSLPQVSSRDLALLEDERLALSSAITEDATLLVSPVLAAPSPLLESLLEHDENSNVMLTKRINQDNKLFIFFTFRNVEEERLKSHKFKLFNPI
jgi:hypothetical protein